MASQWRMVMAVSCVRASSSLHRSQDRRGRDRRAGGRDTTQGRQPDGSVEEEPRCRQHHEEETGEGRGSPARRKAQTRVRTPGAEEDGGGRHCQSLHPKLRWQTAPRRTQKWPALGRPFRLIWTDAPRRWRAVEPNNSLTISRRLPPILTDHHPPRRSRIPNVFGKSWSGREDLNLRPLGPEPSRNLRNCARIARISRSA
jgi:hypothetical protein